MRTKEEGLVGLAPRRRAAGFTQQSYADALGVDRARVGMYEIGKAWPPAALLPAMAALLGCSIDELYELPVEGKIFRCAQDDKGAKKADCHTSDVGPWFAMTPQAARAAEDVGLYERIVAQPEDVDHGT